MVHKKGVALKIHAGMADPANKKICHFKKWAHLDSNQGPTGYEPVALPAELWARK